MTRHPVSSSNLRSVGYDPGTLTLEVEFQDGAIYQYLQVPPAIYAGLMCAASKGGYLHDYIKDHYQYRKVR
jgi:hypothetical protein